METRTCPNPDCDAAQIATTETLCPACGVNIAEMDEQIAAVDRAHRALVKKRKAEKAKRDAENPPAPPAPAPAPKKSFLSNLVPPKKG